MTNSDATDRSRALRTGLNVHGFGFHYAVIAEILRIASREPDLGWQFIGAEVPLSLNGKDTHADFIFFSAIARMYLIGECKRSDPAYAEWCFARSQYALGRNRHALVDQLRFADPQKLYLDPATTKRAAYQVGISVKNNDRPGEGCVSDKRAIPEHATQVLRASNAFIELCRDNPSIASHTSRGNVPFSVVPAIFTTARLHAAEADLSVAELETGDLPKSVTFLPARWLWYQHALTKSLQAQVAGRYEAHLMEDWPSYFGRSAVRSVAVVGTGGIRDFLDYLVREPAH